MKAAHDGVAFQKLAELLFDMYLKNDKSIMKVVTTYVASNARRQKDKTFDDLEIKELYRELETHFSPLKDINKVVEKMKEEKKNEDTRVE
jgi:hypothetical protein